MAKKTPAKKPRRRLKRSVRRSLAAVLMVTAIAVAAIPVPENYADNGDAAAGSMTRAAVDVHTDAIKKDFIYDITKANTNYGQASTWAKTNLSKFVTKDAGGEPVLNEDAIWNSYEGNVSTPTHASMAIRNVDGVDALSWQFMYYEVDLKGSGLGSGTRGVICKYNGEYMAVGVDLPLVLNTKYYTVEESIFTNYFAGRNPDGKEGDLDNKAWGKYVFRPSNYEYEYTLSQYQAGIFGDDETEYFFKTYFASDVERKQKEFQLYLDSKDEETGEFSEDESLIEPLVRKPQDITDSALQMQFYCEQDTFLRKQAEPYTLVPVQDQRPDDKDGGIVYVAKGGKPGLSSYNDNDGYLVVEQANYLLCGIGDCAFKGNNRIQNLQLPSMISFIGDHAFEGASLIKEINIENAPFIGNQAFKNCGSLSKVQIGEGVETIGAECFYHTAVNSVKLPSTVQNIGYGAFASCNSLTDIDMNAINQDCTIADFAFYECPSLTNVQMKDAQVVSIGKGAFACTGGAELDFVFPSLMPSYIDGVKTTNSIGDFLFAGRANLHTVVFPETFYGRTETTKVKLPDNMFHECSNMSYVVFPADNDQYSCGYVSYSADKLFADVANIKFYVKGPKMKNISDAADPRTTTWKAVMAVAGNPIPYLYIENGKEYYEVSNGIYLYCVNSDGMITSCTLTPDAKDNLSAILADRDQIALSILPEVGTTKVVGIAKDCFTDEDLNQNVKSLVIPDDSLTEIEDDVFKGWKKLTRVTIGNSVNTIGDRAFADCSSLSDVTFHSPLAGHEAFEVGTDAFKTGSDQLTFHGDIVKGYAPFDWAMDPGNIIDKDKPDSEGIRVCYKSMSPYYLTVMYNPITKMVTMLDYPKADQIDSILTTAHSDDLNGASSYNEYREQYLYTLYNNGYYDTYRSNFANAWSAAGDNAELKEAAYRSDNYGPWINPNFCDNWDKWIGDTTPGGTTDNSSSGSTSSGDTSTDPDNNGTEGDGDTSAIDKLADFLFEPITAYAADNPKPYYDIYEYDVVKNAAANDPYRPSTPEEDYLLYAVENIVVPEGVDSIDVYGFVNNLTSEGETYKGGSESNRGNYARYFNLGWDTDTRTMYTRSTGEDENVKIVPGLFSGYYKDFKDESGFEKFKRGNDSIKTVTLESVKYLPDYAFDSCEQLYHVSLGPECADIGTAPFRGCYALSSVAGNEYYEADNGIIYSKDTDGTYMIEECFASRGKPGIVGQASVSLSNDPKLGLVSAIRPGAFEDCDVITDVNFGSNSTAGLKEIPADCFRNCDDLQRVVLPVTVDDVGREAFVGSNRLSDLTFYGKEVKISGSAFDNDPAKAVTRVRTYEDSAVVRYVKEYGTEYKLQLDDNTLGEQWLVTFLGPDYKVITDLKDIDGNVIDNPQYVENNTRAVQPQDLESTEDWTFSKWVGMNGTKVDALIKEDTVFYAQGYSNNGMVNGQYVVEFYDSVDGTKLGQTQYVDPGKFAIAPMYATHAGFTFDKWSEDPNTTPIQSNKTFLAMYKPNTSLGTTSGNTTNTSGNVTNTSGNTTNSSGNTTSSSSNTSSSSSTSTSSTTSGSDAAATLHRVTVMNGSGSGMYATGATVIIAANEPRSGQKFKEWTTQSSGVTFNQMTATATQFVMPDNDVLVIANFEGGEANDAAGGTANTVSTINNPVSTVDNGNTRVDILKPGISNKDLATANVNGSTDNFIVKITETDDATRAVADALTNKYGSLDNILYYAMDISLWDSTGSYRLTGDQLAGLTVDITIPIPDALVAYGGNNMAGAVINGNQLESLNENFTTINGVPCIRFTATHFSPYTVYVNTGNLTEGMLDATPKTGDPIHPKWFLSIGLACLSIILFMKKDKKVKVKTA